MFEANNNINMEIIDCLCREFQSLWLIDVKTQAMQFYMQNTSAAQEAVEKGKELMNYEPAITWYTDRYIIPEHRERIKKEASLEYVIQKLQKSPTYLVDYRRIIGDEINFNQLYYAKLNSENDSIDYFVLGFRSIDRIKKAELDDLTGLYNRNSFISYAERYMNKNPDKIFNIVISDFVNFKKINENYGPSVGDTLLKGAAAFLESIRKPNLIVGRFGGDQFVCLVEDEDFENYLLSSNIVEALPSPDESFPKPEVKLGVCANLKAGDSILLACDRAHTAANSIKHKYNQSLAVYNSDLQSAIDRQAAIELDMRDALRENQFKVFYQPKHDTATGKIIGAEALIRWFHPRFGFMSPGEFIPIFERNGFIVEADYFVYRRTCQNLRRWMDKGIDIVPVSVNASKLTFESPHMLHRVNNSMAIHNIPGKYIHIEITESLMSDNTDKLIRKLSDLRKQNIQIELDDFGSGFSSINLLSTLPLDVIKLDMSFMQQFGDDKRAKVLEACVGLAKNLGYKTVSEGVETKEQLDSLKELGVDAIQGYYYSKPLPEEEFEAYLQANA